MTREYGGDERKCDHKIKTKEWKEDRSRGIVPKALERSDEWSAEAHRRDICYE